MGPCACVRASVRARVHEIESESKRESETTRARACPHTYAFDLRVSTDVHTCIRVLIESIGNRVPTAIPRAIPPTARCCDDVHQSVRGGLCMHASASARDMHSDVR